MSLISTFREPVRMLLGDLAESAAEQQYRDSAIDKGLRSVVLFGQINVDGATYTVNPVEIVPEVTNPKIVLLLCAQCALMFIQAEPSKKAVALRGLRKSVGDYKLLVQQLDRMIYKVKSNGGIEVFRSFEMWLTDACPEFGEWWERWNSGESYFGSAGV